MPLPQQVFDFAAGENLTGLNALAFTVDADRYPNGATVNYRMQFFRANAPTAILLNVTGSDVVASLQFKIPLTRSNTQSLAMGGYSWIVWDEDVNDLKLAEGRVNVTRGKVT